MLVRVKLPLIAAISLLTVFVDQATKSLAAQHLIRGEVHSYLFDTVRIVYAENIGAFLGLGGHLSSGARFWVFVVLVGLFLRSAEHTSELQSRGHLVCRLLLEEMKD